MFNVATKKISVICLVGIFTASIFNITFASGYSIPIQGVVRKSSNTLVIASLSNASFGPGNILGSQVSSDGNVQTTAITIQDAVQNVLARVPGASINDIKIKLKNIDSIFEGSESTANIHYVGTVRHGNNRYDFEIDGLTGHFIAWE